MAQDKCFIRVKNLLDKSSISSTKADEILTEIKKAQGELKISSLDSVNADSIAKTILEKKKVDKQIKKRNALENEIKIRNYVDYVLREFPENPEEGLIAILVGSNDQKIGARESVALKQFSTYRQLLAGFDQKLKDANLDSFFANTTEAIDRKIARAMEQISKGEPVTETIPEIKKIAEIMENYSEMIRKQMNNRGANIPKLFGWIVRQTHDAYKVRDAARVLGKTVDTTGKDKNFDVNREAWKEYILRDGVLDERTFADVEDRDEFLNFVYASIIRNDYGSADGVAGAYGSRDITKARNAKRVLHFVNSDAWFEYNQKFGTGNLKETFFGGINIAGRTLGILDTLGTKPSENFSRIQSIVQNRLAKMGKSTESISGNKFEKYLMVVDGRIYGVENFTVAKWSAITRSIAAMSKLGFAAISAMSDVGLYASEVKYQGRSFFGGIFEAFGSLGKIKTSGKKQEIARQLGFIADNLIYDLSARYSIGDNLNKRFTKIQRTFFKYNLLNWWTNSLKEGSMLGLSNYIAKNRNVSFTNLNERLRMLMQQFNVDENLWNILRKMDVEKADDGTEFFSVRNIEKLSDKEIISTMDLKNPTKRQIQIARENLKTSISGIFLDRSLYSVIEADARTQASLTQGTLAGTPIGEAIRFFAQFKAFPIAIVQKALGREISFFKSKNAARGAFGIGSIVATSILLGYVSMTAKDLLKGKTPRDPTKLKTFFAAALQGGGLGIYGDFLFTETKGAMDFIGRLAGPVPGTAAEVIQAIQWGIQGKKDAALKQSYKTVTGNIPFLNLFYLKSAFDYIIGYQMMESLSPGVLRRIERKMRKEQGQEFLFTNPSSMFKGF